MGAQKPALLGLGRGESEIMNRMFALALCVPLVAGCNPELQAAFSGLPKGVVAEDVVLFDDAVASIGCALTTEGDYLATEFQTGFPREKVQSIASYQVSKREAVITTSGGFQLVTGACPVLLGAQTTDTAASLG